MSYNGSRMPLHMQQPIISKSLTNVAGPKAQVPKDLIQHNSRIREMPKPSTHHMSVMRRNHDGTLDFDWAKNMVIDALHNAKSRDPLSPVECALLKVVYPELDLPMMGALAELRTKLSSSEKKKIRNLCEAHLKEETNWNAGRGGGNVPITRGGTP